MPDASSTSTLDKVTFRDWLLALIGLLFTLAGLLILPTNPKVGIASLALFGPCLALFVHIILRKLRQQKLPQLTATVVGGQPIRPSRARIAKLGAGLLAVGTILIVFRINDKPMFLASVLLIAMTGAVLLVGLATGFLPRTYIQFDPPGLTFGTMRAKATIPWSAITNVVRGEIQGNQAVLLWVDLGSVVVEPASETARIHTQVASSIAWNGADFVIMSSSYGVDAPVLLAAIERYVRFPAARAELHGDPKLGN
jgi:hypothetical protein